MKWRFSKWGKAICSVLIADLLINEVEMFEVGGKAISCVLIADLLINEVEIFEVGKSYQLCFDSRSVNQ